MTAAPELVAPPGDSNGPESEAPLRFARMSRFQFAKLAPLLLRDRAEAFRKISREYGDVVEVPVPGKRIFLVTHPDPTRTVFQKNNRNYRRSFDFRIFQTFFGDGMVTTHDDTWRHIRKVSNPSFGRRSVEKLTGRLVSEVDTFLNEQVPGRTGTITATESMTTLSLRMFAGAMYERDPRADETELLRLIGTVFRHLDRRLVSLVDIDAFLPTPSNRRFKKARVEFYRIMKRWVQEQRERTAAKAHETANLLEILIAASENLPEGDFPEPDVWLRDQMTTFLVAGHETVAVTMAWTLMLLTEHPAIQEKVREECRAAMNAQHPKAEDFKSLTYTNAVLKESLRLFPPFWTSGREAIDEDVLAGHTIPKGATVVLSPYVVQRREEYWDAPDEFRPERFLEDVEREPFVYAPFGGGARHCIGEHLSMLELRVTLAMLLARFRVERPDSKVIGRDALVSLRPKPDFDLRLTRID